MCSSCSISKVFMHHLLQNLLHLKDAPLQNLFAEAVASSTLQQSLEWLQALANLPNWPGRLHPEGNVCKQLWAGLIAPCIGRHVVVLRGNHWNAEVCCVSKAHGWGLYRQLELATQKAAVVMVVAWSWLGVCDCPLSARSL